MYDRVGDQWHAGDRLDDRQLAALNSFGDRDFTLAGQQWNGPHLAEIHTDGIVGLVDRARGQVEFDLGALASPIE